MSATAFTDEQMDDLRAFVRAAINVANYGMNQTMMDANSPVGSVRCSVTGDTFKATAAKALPHLGMTLRAEPPKTTRAAKGKRHG